MLKLKKLLSYASVLLVVFAIAGCSSVPLPADMADYAGKWQSADMTITITKDGYVDYKRVGQGSSRSGSGPIKEYMGDGFVVGVMFIKTKFKVEKRPYLSQGKTKMVVDGVELTKATF